MNLAVTCGDPAGVGPEIIARWLAEAPMRETISFTAIGPASWLDSLPRRGDLAYAATGASDFRAAPGKPTEAGASAALDAMEKAAAGTIEGRFDAVVTGPIAKIWLQRAGFSFPGQSEFFADRWKGEPTMGFTGGKLRVVLATWHIPLREVAVQLSRWVLERTIKHGVWMARAEGIEQPRIAVCGLNPHAGEDGMLGREEIDRINPWLRELAATFPGLGTCLPGDTVFARMLRGEFDVIVALYHDQGLAPLKAVDFDTSVNVTLGLAHIRTSPDHGTAFGIAGTGVADPRSFSQAVKTAIRLAEYRRSHPFER